MTLEWKWGMAWATPDGLWWITPPCWWITPACYEVWHGACPGSGGKRVAEAPSLGSACDRLGEVLGVYVQMPQEADATPSLRLPPPSTGADADTPPEMRDLLEVSLAHAWAISKWALGQARGESDAFPSEPPPASALEDLRAKARDALAKTRAESARDAVLRRDQAWRFGILDALGGDGVRLIGPSDRTTSREDVLRRLRDWAEEAGAVISAKEAAEAQVAMLTARLRACEEMRDEYLRERNEAIDALGTPAKDAGEHVEAMRRLVKDEEVPVTHCPVCGFTGFFRNEGSDHGMLRMSCLQCAAIFTWDEDEGVARNVDTTFAEQKRRKDELARAEARARGDATLPRWRGTGEGVTLALAQNTTPGASPESGGGAKDTAPALARKPSRWWVRLLFALYAAACIFGAGYGVAKGLEVILGNARVRASVEGALPLESLPDLRDAENVVQPEACLSKSGREVILSDGTSVSLDGPLVGVGREP